MKQKRGGVIHNQGDDGENGFGGPGHDNKDVSNCDDGSNNDNRHGQEMLGLKTPIYKKSNGKIWVEGCNFGHLGVPCKPK